MPRAVLRGACLQYTMAPRSGLDKTAFTAVLHGSMFSSPVRESASAHEERAAAQAAGLRLLYHGAAKRPRQNRIHCGFAWFNVLKPCARKRISARRARGRASGGLEVIIPYFRLYVMLSVHICQKTAALCRCGRGCGGEGKMTVRGGEAMAAKRTAAQGGFAQRNAAPDFARQTQKVGPVTGRAVSRSEMRPNGSKRRGFAVGDPARQSRDGDGKTSAPVGPMTGCAVSPQAKCDRMGASAGVLPLGTRRGAGVTGTAK